MFHGRRHSQTDPSADLIGLALVLVGFIALLCCISASVLSHHRTAKASVWCGRYEVKVWWASMSILMILPYLPKIKLPLFLIASLLLGLQQTRREVFWSKWFPLDWPFIHTFVEKLLQIAFCLSTEEKRRQLCFSAVEITHPLVCKFLPRKSAIFPFLQSVVTQTPPA